MTTDNRIDRRSSKETRERIQIAMKKIWANRNTPKKQWEADIRADERQRTISDFARTITPKEARGIGLVFNENALKEEHDKGFKDGANDRVNACAESFIQGWNKGRAKLIDELMGMGAIIDTDGCESAINFPERQFSEMVERIKKASESAGSASSEGAPISKAEASPAPEIQRAKSP